MTLESIAGFIVLSRLTVITIGGIKFLSLHLSSLITLPFFWSFSGSSSTCACRWIGILRPLWWMGVKFVLNFDFTVWFFVRPILFIRLGSFLAISIFKFCLSGFCIIATCLPSALGEGCWLTWIPSPWNRSRPIIALWLFGTTMRSAFPAFQPLHSMSQYSVPTFLIGAFVKLLMFVGFVLRLHQLFLSLSSISCTIISVTKLFELPESTTTQYLVLPNLMQSFVGVGDTSVGEINSPYNRPLILFWCFLFRYLMKPYLFVLQLVFLLIRLFHWCCDCWVSVHVGPADFNKVVGFVASSTRLSDGLALSPMLLCPGWSAVPTIMLLELLSVGLVWIASGRIVIASRLAEIAFVVSLISGTGFCKDRFRSSYDWYHCGVCSIFRLYS